MAVILKATNFAVSDDDALAMRGIQTDSYNEIMAGHGAVLDPSQSGVSAGVLAAGDVVENLVVGASDASVILPFNTLSTGLSLTGGADEQLSLPESFDLATLGDDASILLSIFNL